MSAFRADVLAEVARAARLSDGNRAQPIPGYGHGGSNNRRVASHAPRRNNHPVNKVMYDAHLVAGRAELQPTFVVFDAYGQALHVQPVSQPVGHEHGGYPPVMHEVQHVRHQQVNSQNQAMGSYDFNGRGNGGRGNGKRNFINDSGRGGHGGSRDRGEKRQRAGSCKDCGRAGAKFGDMTAANPQKLWCSACVKQHPGAQRIRAKKEQEEREKRSAIFLWAKELNGEERKEPRCAFFCLTGCPSVTKGAPCDRIHECKNCGLVEEGEDKHVRCGKCPPDWWK